MRCIVLIFFSALVALATAGSLNRANQPDSEYSNDKVGDFKNNNMLLPGDQEVEWDGYVTCYTFDRGGKNCQRCKCELLSESEPQDCKPAPDRRKCKYL